MMKELDMKEGRRLKRKPEPNCFPTEYKPFVPPPPPVKKENRVWKYVTKRGHGGRQGKG